MVADGALEHWIRCLQGVQNRRDGHRRNYVNLDLPPDTGEGLEVVRQCNSDHFNVWTSTERTDGKCSPMALQSSPPLGETYTWPPVVPK